MNARYPLHAKYNQHEMHFFYKPDEKRQWIRLFVILCVRMRRTNTEQKVAEEIELWYSLTQAKKKTTHDKQWQNCILAMFGGYNGCEWYTKEPTTQQRKTH